jgi:hypothetical protein
MIPPFDLFREEGDGTLRWLGAVADMDAAKTKARELMAHTPGKYFVYSQTTGNKIYISGDGDLGRKMPAR